jgi:uncharacterized protein
MEKVFFKTSDNLTLCGIWQVPQKETKKAIVLAHGITVTKDEEGIFPELSQMLVEKGYAVFRFDFRGHGESEGKSVDMTITGELDDIAAAVTEVTKRGYEELGLLGASFGGGIASLYAENYQTLLRALCLWNPCLNYEHALINPTLSWISERNEARKEEIETQGWTTIGSRRFVIGKPLYEEMYKTFPYQALSHIIIPTAIFHGTEDTYVPYEDSVEYANSLLNGEFYSIENGKHGFQEPKEQRQEVLQKTVAFFTKNM